MAQLRTSHAAGYPATPLAPAPVPDLSSIKERERLTPGALGAFFNIMDAWKVRAEDARALLGGVSNGRFYAMKQGRGRALDQDRLQRVSLLVGVFKALNILYSRELADAWVGLPNDNRLFGGRTPLTAMLQGGLPTMLQVRRLLDARRGG